MSMFIKNLRKNESLFQKAVVMAVFVLCAAALFTGCGAKSNSRAYYDDADVMREETMMAKSVSVSADMSNVKGSFKQKAKGEVRLDTVAETEEAAVQNNGEDVQTERKLIYTGNISIQVADLTETEKEISGLVEKFNGYITSSSISGRNLHIVARIPQKKFKEAFEAGSAFGTLLNRSISTQDVTEQFYDMYARLETRKILRERLESYLKAAPKIEDMLAIERELNDVQSEIESMEGQFRLLSNRIDYSTIYYDVSLPPNTTEKGFTYPDVGKKFSQFWADALEFLASFLVGIFYVIVFAVPLVLAAAFLYFVCFGRLGLVKKLFALAGKKTNKTKSTEENK